MHWTILDPVRAVVFGLAFIAAGLAQGCGPRGPSEPASPVVEVDSEAAQKARAEDELIRKQRQQQEARARKRFRGLPNEE